MHLEGGSADLIASLDRLGRRGRRHGILDRIGCVAVILLALVGIGGLLAGQALLVGIFGGLAFAIYLLTTLLEPELEGHARLALARELLVGLGSRLEDATGASLELRLHGFDDEPPFEKRRRPSDGGLSVRYAQSWLLLEIDQGGGDRLGLEARVEATQQEDGIRVLGVEREDTLRLRVERAEGLRLREALEPPEGFRLERSDLAGAVATVLFTHERGEGLRAAELLECLERLERALGLGDPPSPRGGADPSGPRPA
ncbi:MAG: hypothetical protein OEY14_05370 [Myxococcales bacterium]|nr:hypothetical protein [Myxococcales bacterium]